MATFVVAGFRNFQIKISCPSFPCFWIVQRVFTTGTNICVRKKEIKSFIQVSCPSFPCFWIALPGLLVLRLLRDIVCSYFLIFTPNCDIKPAVNGEALLAQALV